MEILIIIEKRRNRIKHNKKTQTHMHNKEKKKEKEKMSEYLTYNNITVSLFNNDL